MRAIGASLPAGTEISFTVAVKDLIQGANTLAVVVLDRGGRRYEQVVSFGVQAPPAPTRPGVPVHRGCPLPGRGRGAAGARRPRGAPAKPPSAWGSRPLDQEQPGARLHVREEPGRAQPHGLPGAPPVIALQLAAFALANFLMGASPGDKPFRAVAFLLSLAGHRRAGAPKPVELHKRIRLMAKGVNTALRNRTGLDYDPLDIIEFNSFDDLLRKRPPGGTVWQSIMVVTHAGGEAPAEFPGEIFLGDKAYVVSSGGINDLLDAINAKRNPREPVPRRVRRPQQPHPDRLRRRRDRARRRDLHARALRDRGPDHVSLKNVDFFANGELGTPKDPDKPKVLRRLTDADWEIVTRKDDILNAVDPIVPGDF